MKNPFEYIDAPALARHLEISLEERLGRRTWKGRTRTGEAVAVKTGATAQVINFLDNLRSLHPPFAYPRIITAEAGFYLVYAFIPGIVLSDGDFESAEALAAAFELSGRLTALCRSLKLAPMFQGLQGNTAVGGTTPGAAARRLAALGSGLDYQLDGLAIRRQEAAQSYAWAQQLVSDCTARWPRDDALPTAFWSRLSQRVEVVTSIHLAPQGSNLAHTGFTPEHLLVDAGDRWGIVSWQVAPRPYNYMRYRYLAWCLVHSQRGDITRRYDALLQSMPVINYSGANALTWVLCLVETWVEAFSALDFRAEKLQALSTFFEEAMVVTDPHQPKAARPTDTGRKDSGSDIN
ncbi:MAG: hypothetical protein FJ135_07845 [Deltaproteobacteria bacterium]|nr:hypothetical protein [Deltaproteobacteria bacterium]